MQNRKIVIPNKLFDGNCAQETDGVKKVPDFPVFLAKKAVSGGGDRREGG